MKSYCVDCKEFYDLKRAKRVFSRIESLTTKNGRETKWPVLIYTIFTIPMHLRSKYIDPIESKNLRKKIWTLLKEKYGATWAIESTHPISEKNPKTFHPHFNFLWQSSKWTTGFIDTKELLDLKLDYAEIIGYEYIPDVRTRYSRDDWKLWKWCKYVVRTFSEFVKWAGPVRYFGEVPKVQEKEVAVCEKCLEKFFVLGYLTNEKAAENLDDLHPVLVLTTSTFCAINTD
jgi:hypothetical protein